MRMKSFSRMQVQSGLQAAPVQFVYKGGRIGKQLPVPGIPGPAAARIARFGNMPVHIHNADGERHIVGPKFIHQAQKLFVCIGPIAAPPVAQGPARHHRRGAGHSRKIIQAALEILSKTEKVKIAVRLCRAARFQPTARSRFIIKDETAAVVINGPALARHKPFFQDQRPIYIIQRARRAQQNSADLPGHNARLSRVL